MTPELVYYVIKKDDGFIAIDQHSGGYPYKTTFESARKHKTLNAALESKRSDNGTGILRCVVMTEEVSPEDVNNELRQSALSKLSVQEIRALGLDKN